MQFKAVIGQESTKRKLIQAFAEDRIPHAQLFVGPPGNGKIALAVAYAQYINCTNKHDNDSCGECGSCRKMAQYIHPDLHFTLPVIKTSTIDKPTTNDYIAKWRPYFLENPYPQYEKWMQIIAEENKQGSIFVFEAKELIRKLNQKSYEADYKVSIIWLAETMNDDCANKILKILEEPPQKTLFILISESEEKLLSTIRSRCQLVRIPKISEPELAAAIAPLAASTNSLPSTIARLAKGNYFLALELLQEDEQRNFNFNQFANLMRNGYGRKLQEILSWSEEMAGIGRVKQMAMLKYCGELLRENFISNLKEPSLIFMDDQEQAFSSKFAPFINEKNVLGLFAEFEKGYTDISKNGNAKLIFTDLGLKVSKLIRL
jgi:DNA polymerase-3 subunit delta'